MFKCLCFPENLPNKSNLINRNRKCNILSHTYAITYFFVSGTVPEVCLLKFEVRVLWWPFYLVYELETYTVGKWIYAHHNYIKLETNVISLHICMCLYVTLPPNEMAKINTKLLLVCIVDNGLIEVVHPKYPLLTFCLFHVQTNPRNNIKIQYGRFLVRRCMGTYPGPRIIHVYR